MTVEYPQDAWKVLGSLLTPERRAKMLAVVRQRTKHVQVVLQDVHDPHNVSACLRSAEAFGVLNTHVVTLKESYKPSKVARGVNRWLNIHRHGDVSSAVAALKAEGMLLAAGFPDPNAPPLDALPVDRPVAIIFGNEHAGVHDDWRPHIDLPFTIPMVGFVESLNISVSCAISLYGLTNKAKQLVSNELYYLSEEERQDLLNQWVCQQYPDTYMEQLMRLRSRS